MNDANELSQRRKLRIPYEAIMDAALPGDILFFISDSGKPKFHTWLHQEYRHWLGIHPIDTSIWHTSVYVGPRKESKGAGFRPYIVHAVPKGTEETHIPPEYFRNTSEDGRLQSNRLEIIQYAEVQSADRERIVAYCRQQLGKPFDNDERWYRNVATLLLGIRSFPRAPATASCHGLAYEAYQLIGMSFPHQLEHAPNLCGRIFGHPLGHPADSVDLRSNYLRDHYLYRDPRFFTTIAIAASGPGNDPVIIRRPEKYSWNPKLQTIYRISAGHNP